MSQRIKHGNDSKKKIKQADVRNNHGSQKACPTWGGAQRKNQESRGLQAEKKPALPRAQQEKRTWCSVRAGVGGTATERSIAE